MLHIRQQEKYIYDTPKEKFAPFYLPPRGSDPWLKKACSMYVGMCVCVRTLFSVHSFKKSCIILVSDDAFILASLGIKKVPKRIFAKHREVHLVKDENVRLASGLLWAKAFLLRSPFSTYSLQQKKLGQVIKWVKILNGVYFLVQFLSWFNLVFFPYAASDFVEVVITILLHHTTQNLRYQTWKYWILHCLRLKLFAHCCSM